MAVVAPKRPYGPKIVRSWFDCIINPLLRAIEHEQRILTAGHYGWRSNRPRLENVSRLDAYLEADTRDNFDQLCEHFPELASMVQEHDDQAEWLLKGCQQTHKFLVERWLEWAGPVLVDGGLKDADGLPVDVNKPETRAFITELVINNDGLLPEHYLLHPIWNSLGEKLSDAAKRLLLQLVNTASDFIRTAEREPSTQNVTAAAADGLLTVDTKLDARLRRLRSELAAEFDEPYASRP